MPSLMADMYGFTSEEEMSDMKGLSPLPQGLSVRTGECQVTGCFVVFCTSALVAPHWLLGEVR